MGTNDHNPRSFNYPTRGRRLGGGSEREREAKGEDQRSEAAVRTHWKAGVRGHEGAGLLWHRSLHGEEEGPRRRGHWSVGDSRQGPRLLQPGPVPSLTLCTPSSTSLKPYLS